LSRLGIGVVRCRRCTCRPWRFRTFCAGQGVVVRVRDGNVRTGKTVLASDGRRGLEWSKSVRLSEEKQSDLAVDWRDEEEVKCFNWRDVSTCIKRTNRSTVSNFSDVKMSELVPLTSRLNGNNCRHDAAVHTPATCTVL
jgi:hypothetical protein